MMVKASLYPCAHCEKTGTCTNGSGAESCASCVGVHGLNGKKQYRGLPCGNCGGLGMAEPLSERLNNRVRPIAGMFQALSEYVVAIVLMLVVLFCIFKDSASLPVVLAFVGPLIGALLGRQALPRSLGRTNHDAR